MLIQIKENHSKIILMVLWKIASSQGMWLGDVFPTWTRKPTITISGLELNTVILNPVGLGLSKKPSSDAKLSLTPFEWLFQITSPPILMLVTMQVVFSKKSRGNSGLIPAFAVLLRMPGPSFFICSELMLQSCLSNSNPRVPLPIPNEKICKLPSSCKKKHYCCP